MKFKLNQTVVVVDRENFFQELKYGHYKLATISEVKKDAEGRTYYKAVDGEGNEVSNIVGGPYEFDSIDYIKEVYLRFANEARGEAAYYYDIAASLDQ